MSVQRVLVYSPEAITRSQRRNKRRQKKNIFFCH